MWYRPDDWFLAQSLQAADGLTALERISLHWALLIKRYQFFYDLSSSIGRLFEFRDEISIDLIRTRVFELWGFRGTLDACIRKNVKTIREMKFSIMTSAHVNVCFYTELGENRVKIHVSWPESCKFTRQQEGIV